MVYTTDLKSVAREGLRVRVSQGVPTIGIIVEELTFQWTNKELEWLCFVNDLSLPDLLSVLYTKYRIKVEMIDNV